LSSRNLIQLDREHLPSQRCLPSAATALDPATERDAFGLTGASTCGAGVVGTGGTGPFE